jgi:hypothetical protein
MINPAAPGKKAPEYLRSSGIQVITILPTRETYGAEPALFVVETMVNSGSGWGWTAMDGEVGGSESIGAVQRSSPLLYRYREVKNMQESLLLRKCSTAFMEPHVEPRGRAYDR